MVVFCGGCLRHPHCEPGCWCLLAQAWIEKRMRSISVRGELTDEWKARGVAEGKEYSILTAEIACAMHTQFTG